MNFWVVFLFIFMCSAGAFARVESIDKNVKTIIQELSDEIALSRQAKQSLTHDLRAQHIIINDMLIAENAAKVTPAGLSKWQEAYVSEKLKNVLAQTQNTPYQQKKLILQAVKKQVRQLEYKPIAQKLNEVLKQKYSGAISKVRRFGAMSAVLYLTGSSSKYLASAVLVSLNKVALASAASIAPISLMMPSIYMGARAIARKRLFIKLLGGIEEYRIFQHAHRRTKTLLQMIGPSYLASLNIQGGKVLEIQAPKWWSSLLSKAGLNKNANYTTLKDFFRGTHLEGDARFIADLNLTKQQKSLLFLDLVERADLKTQSRFKLRFDKNFVSFADDQVTREVMNWVSDLKTVSSFQDLYHYMGKVPRQADGDLVYRLWNKMVLPHMADTIPPAGVGLDTLKTFRRLSDEGVHLRADLIKNNGDRSNLLQQFLKKNLTGIHYCESIFFSGI
jgi:hypothetical protein